MVDTTPRQRAVLEMFAAMSAAASAVVYFNQVNIPPLPSGDWLRLRDGPSLLEEQADSTRTGDLASVGGTVWPAAATLCTWLREHLCRNQARDGRSEPPERLIRRGWPEPGAA